MSYVTGYKAHHRKNFCTQYKHDLMQILGVSPREASRIMKRARVKKHVKYDSFILTGDPALYIFKTYFNDWQEKYVEFIIKKLYENSKLY